MAFEKTVPDWSAVGVEPPASLKAGGFQAGYKPPADYFNWFWYTVSQCLNELHEKGLTESEILALLEALRSELSFSNVPNEVIVEKIIEAGAGGIPIVSATSTDGIAYTATAEGVTELYDGLMITIIANKLSTSTTCTLNLNGLGAKNMRYTLGYNTGNSGALPPLAGWLGEGVPVTLIYKTKFNVWHTCDIQRPSANAIYGTIKVENGGTDADNAEDACANLGAVRMSAKLTTTLSASGWSSGVYTLSNGNITATSVVELLPAESGAITSAQMEALTNAMIVGGAQAAGSIKLISLGETPSIDIPVTLIFRRDL